MAIVRTFSVNLDPLRTVLTDISTNGGVAGKRDGGYVIARNNLETRAGELVGYDFDGEIEDFSVHSATFTDVAVYSGGYAVSGTLADGRVIVATSSGGVVNPMPWRAVSPADSSNPDIAATGRGGTYGVVFQRQYGSNADIQFQTFNSSNGPESARVQVDPSNADDRNPSIGFFDEDAFIGTFLAVAWHRVDAEGNATLYYATYDSQGNVYKKPTAVEYLGKVKSPPSVMSSSGRTLDIVYEDNSDGQTVIKVAKVGLSDAPVIRTLTKGTDGVEVRNPIVAELDRFSGGTLTGVIHERVLVDSGGDRAWDVMLTLYDQSNTNRLTPISAPILIAMDATNPSIDSLALGEDGRFVITYEDFHGGDVKAQLGQVVETITGDSAANILSPNYRGAVVADGKGGNDTVQGGRSDDSLSGGDGNDTILNGLGDDIIQGGNGTDTLSHAGVTVAITINLGVVVQQTGLGRDTIAGIENVVGGQAADTLTGSSGKNILDGGGSSAIRDTLVGAGGNDTYIVRDSLDVVIETRAGDGTDAVNAYVSFELPDFVEDLTLLGSAATGTGNALANRITGTSGANTLRGLEGNDTLNGGGGADRLTGGTGKDTLTGGTNSDIFYFNTALGATNIDTITDYNATADTIYLDNAVFKALSTTGTLSSGAFKANTTGVASDSTDRIVYETDTGKLFYDADGNKAGGVAGIHFATLSNEVTITAADFVVI